MKKKNLFSLGDWNKTTTATATFTIICFYSVYRYKKCG